MHPESARRGRLLYVALAFLGLDLSPAAQPSGRARSSWLHTWHGIGLIEQRLARQDRDRSLTRYRARWGATAFVTGMEHSIVQGSGWQPTPWGAVQQAAFQALHRGRYWSDQPHVLQGGAGPELAAAAFVQLTRFARRPSPRQRPYVRLW